MRAVRAASTALLPLTSSVSSPPSNAVINHVISVMRVAVAHRSNAKYRLRKYRSFAYSESATSVANRKKQTDVTI